MLPTRERGGKSILCSRKTVELSRIVCPRSKKFGTASGEGEGDQWLGGIRLWRTSDTQCLSLPPCFCSHFLAWKAFLHSLLMYLFLKVQLLCEAFLPFSQSLLILLNDCTRVYLMKGHSISWTISCSIVCSPQLVSRKGQRMNPL